MRYGEGQAVRKQMLNFGNCTVEPVFEWWTLIVDINPPPVLHMLIVHITTMHK